MVRHCVNYGKCSSLIQCYLPASVPAVFPRRRCRQTSCVIPNARGMRNWVSAAPRVARLIGPLRLRMRQWTVSRSGAGGMGVPSYPLTGSQGVNWGGTPSLRNSSTGRGLDSCGPFSGHSDRRWHHGPRPARQGRIVPSAPCTTSVACAPKRGCLLAG